jgi:hypothetical protein
VTSSSSSGPPSGPLPPQIEKRVAGFVSFVVSQIPFGYILVTGYVPFQFYQPLIYDGYQWFLLIPAVVALAAIYWVERSSAAFLWVFVFFLLLGIVVLVLYRYFPPHSEVHFWNWILWNCLIALTLALALRLYLYFRGLGP